MKNIRITRNPYLLFLPFLCFYLVYIFFFQKIGLWGDEIRHVAQVENLLHGFYSPPAPHVELRSGPGYPILMLPFMALHIPIIFIKLLNGVLLYLSVVILYKILMRIVPFKIALLFSFFWACYYNALDFIAVMQAEIVAIFLVAALLLLLMKAFEPGNIKKANKYVILAGVAIGYLALTKVIFGYVMLCMLIGCSFLLITNRRAINYQKGVIIFLVAFLTVSPYLIYTYQLTGRVFYWGTSGGDNLYWMSSPYKDEYGSWFPGDMIGLDSVLHSPNKDLALDLKSKAVYVNGTNDSLKARHLANFLAVYKFTGTDRDDAFRKVVYKNIKSHPGKYLMNIVSNIGRILFNYPYSYTAQKPTTLARLPLNGSIVLLMLFCLIPTLMNWKKIIYPLRFMLFFVAIYLGGSVFGTAEVRMFTVIVPALLVWIAFVLQRTVSINLKFNGKKE